MNVSLFAVRAAYNFVFNADLPSYATYQASAEEIIKTLGDKKGWACLTKANEYALADPHASTFEVVELLRANHLNLR